MKYYEYKIIDYHRGSRIGMDESGRFINERGAEGWELISNTHLRLEVLRMVFKRRISWWAAWKIRNPLP